MKSTNPFAEYGEEPLQKQILDNVTELGRVICMMMGSDFGLILPRNVYDQMSGYMSFADQDSSKRMPQVMLMHTPSGVCKFHTANDVEMLPNFIRSPGDIINPTDMVFQMDHYKTKDLEFLRENIRLTQEIARLTAVVVDLKNQIVGG